MEISKFGEELGRYANYGYVYAIIVLGALRVRLT